MSSPAALPASPIASPAVVASPTPLASPVAQTSPAAVVSPAASPATAASPSPGAVLLPAPVGSPSPSPSPVQAISASAERVISDYFDSLARDNIAAANALLTPAATALRIPAGQTSPFTAARVVTSELVTGGANRQVQRIVVTVSPAADALGSNWTTGENVRWVERRLPPEGWHQPDRELTPELADAAARPSRPTTTVTSTAPTAARFVRDMTE